MTSHDKKSPLGVGARLGALVLWLVFLAGFGVGGWFLVLEPAATAAGNWWQARDYLETPASVVAKQGKDADGSFTWFAARYEVAGRSFETARLSVLENNQIDERSNATVTKRLQQAHASNSPVSIWVSPRKPEVAIVSRDLPFDSLWPNALAATMFAVFAIAGALGFVGTIFNARWYRRQHDAIVIWLFSGFWCGVCAMFFLLAASEAEREVAAMIGLSFFLLIGTVLLYAAVYSSWIASEEKLQQMSKSLKHSSNRGATRSKKANPQKDAKQGISRGGLGGRGDEFDKD
jgi:hypothetical protein